MTTKEKPFKELPYPCNVADCPNWATVLRPIHTPEVVFLPLCAKHALTVERQSAKR